MLSVCITRETHRNNDKSKNEEYIRAIVETRKRKSRYQSLPSASLVQSSIRPLFCFIFRLSDLKLLVELSLGTSVGALPDGGRHRRLQCSIIEMVPGFLKLALVFLFIL